MFNQLGLIGCGLMGGSFALALKRAGLVKRVIGYSKSPSTTDRAVAERIQRDADFAKTAQTYMSEFEQLLQQAATGPNPAAQALEYLLSDRGRVYTMLAHASGRLG